MKTILVPVDFSDVTLKVIKVAVHLAKPFQSKIILMHVSQLRPSLMGIGAGPDAVPVPQTSEPIAVPDYTERFAHLKEMVASIGLVSTIVEVEHRLRIRASISSFWDPTAGVPFLTFSWAV